MRQYDDKRTRSRSYERSRVGSSASAAAPPPVVDAASAGLLPQPCARQPRAGTSATTARIGVRIEHDPPHPKRGPHRLTHQNERASEHPTSLLLSSLTARKALRSSKSAARTGYRRAGERTIPAQVTRAASTRSTSTRPTTSTAARVAARATAQRAQQAKTSSERGKVFRERQRQYEQDMMAQVRLLRKEVKQLKSVRERIEYENARAAEQAPLRQPVAPRVSLVELVEQLYAVLRHGLATSTGVTATVDLQRQRCDRATADNLLAIKYKEDFLRRVFDASVVHGDLVGIDAVIDQWRKHTAACSTFVIDLDSVDSIAKVDQNQIVIARYMLHTRYSRESFPVMFPRALETRPELASKFIDRDFALECTVHFHFSSSGLVNFYILEIDLTGAFVREIGSARDVADLMQFSVLTKDSIIQDMHSCRTRDENDVAVEPRLWDEDGEFHLQPQQPQHFAHTDGACSFGDPQERVLVANKSSQRDELSNCGAHEQRQPFALITEPTHLVYRADGSTDPFEIRDSLFIGAHSQRSHFRS